MTEMDVISFGSVFLEIVFGHLERLPLPGEEIYVDPFAFSCGGAVTIAVAASRAGATAGLATLLGDDLGSRLVVEHSLCEGVDLSPSHRVTGPVVGITVVLNFNRDRAFISHMPPKPSGLGPEVERWLEVLQRVRPAWCYVHAGPGVADFLGQARALGTRVALDLNFGVIDDHPDEVVRCARLADVFLPNEEELLRLTRSEDLGEAIALGRLLVSVGGGQARPGWGNRRRKRQVNRGHRRPRGCRGEGPHRCRRRIRRGDDRDPGARGGSLGGGRRRERRGL